MGYNKKSKKSYFLIVGIFVLLIYSFTIFDRNVKPTLLALTEIKAKSIATQAINQAVQDEIKDDMKYEDLIKVSYNNDGKVSIIQANTILMNQIASEIALGVKDNIKKISNISEIKIPLGNTINSQILSQYGPKITVKIVPKGSVKVDFATEFEESGINQTIHRVYLTINVSVRIIVPLAADTANISSTVPIAETIIVGDVPQSYVNIPKEDVTNVIPGM